MTLATQSTASRTIVGKKIQIILAAICAILILATVVFSPLEVIHNATHDTRHSSGFPCH